MTDIPRARQLILQSLALLTEAESLMTRPSPIRRAKPNSTPITPTLARRIRIYAQKHTGASYKEIGARHNVDVGRVSEVLRGLR
jgi:hypothetical protein